MCETKVLNQYIENLQLRLNTARELKMDSRIVRSLRRDLQWYKRIAEDKKVK